MSCGLPLAIYGRVTCSVRGLRDCNLGDWRKCS